ncbi:hypothetical protein Bccel_2305 [Pseudobacteroides cellulosolvens ATCC 35603 = DSM 2933]|uniref:Uncharacterized protein n=1 Tax=Pseudobacteroides cellulosolvens ATCC 35603 = DSM 2933 TaxID=398512 RepID=A0A0L6JMP9_9FIRM|nr:hypothetical protein Bccel_2305 [Pseudobacteroides cellulosolvens ATCC 35603 = DSM 2933]
MKVAYEFSNRNWFVSLVGYYGSGPLLRERALVGNYGGTAEICLSSICLDEGLLLYLIILKLIRGSKFFKHFVGDDWLNYIDIVAIFFIAMGAITTFGAKAIVKKLELNNRMTCDFENEMSEEELEEYLFNKAVVRCKMLGMIIALPGFIMFLAISRG